MNEESPDTKEEIIMANWTKLKSGEWGISGSTREVKAGWTIQVQRRDGTVSMVTVDKVLWRGDGRALATVAGENAKQDRRRNTPDECPTCGEDEAWECGCADPWHDSH